MAISIKDVHWVAGILEGEGSFVSRNKHNPIIQLCMSDLDIVIRAAKIVGSHKVTRSAKKTAGDKWMYRLVLYGSRAISWMMTIYSLMGRRRQKQILDCLITWKGKKTKSYKERQSYSRGAFIAWERLGDRPSQITQH